MKTYIKKCFLRVICFIIACSIIVFGMTVNATAIVLERDKGAVYQGAETDNIRPYLSVSCTNNLSTTQTITLKMNDNEGIKGYGVYCITSNFLKPVGGISYHIVETTSNTVTITADTPGEYIFVAVDNAGNYSVSKTIVMHRYKLDANGGNTSIDSVLFETNNYSFPIPNKNGFRFIGWSANKPDDYESQNGQNSGTISLIQSDYETTLYANWLSERSSFADNKRPTASINASEGDSYVSASLKMSDENGIIGYYFGTNPDYLKNLFVASNETSSSRYINSSGTYYLTSLDKAYNASLTDMITICEITLDANEGSFSWYYSENGTMATLQHFSGKTVLKQLGSIITPDEPFRTDYHFNGWSTQKTNGSGFNSFTVSGNAVYYAQWYKDNVPPTLSLSCTKNMASSQTVTLKMSDNIGIKGYGICHDKVNLHWVGPRTYIYDIIQTESNTVSITLTEPGIYYFVAVDTSENYSAQASVGFIQYELNAAGGTVDPSSLLYPSGTVNLPVPVRKDNVFCGWVDSSTIDNGTIYFKQDYVEHLSATWGKESKILGDTDNDGSVTIIDATCIQRYLAEIPVSVFYEKAADTDEDGEVTIIDATLIQRYLVKLPIYCRIDQKII